MVVDCIYAQQGGIFLVLGGRTGCATHSVAFAQPELLDLLDRDIHIRLGGEVALDAEKAVAVVSEIQMAFNVYDMGGVLVALLSVAAAIAAALLLGLILV